MLAVFLLFALLGIPVSIINNLTLVNVLIFRIFNQWKEAESRLDLGFSVSGVRRWGKWEGEYQIMQPEKPILKKFLIFS